MTRERNVKTAQRFGSPSPATLSKEPLFQTSPKLVKLELLPSLGCYLVTQTLNAPQVTALLTVRNLRALSGDLLIKSSPLLTDHGHEVLGLVHLCRQHEPNHVPAGIAHLKNARPTRPTGTTMISKMVASDQPNAARLVSSLAR